MAFNFILLGNLTKRRLRCIWLKSLKGGCKIASFFCSTFCYEFNDLEGTMGNLL